MICHVPLMLSRDFPLTAESLRPEAYYGAYGYRYEYPTDTAGAVAVVRVSGPFWDGRLYDRLQARLVEACADPGIVGVVIAWDCPGGLQLGVSDLADWLAAAPKPIWSHVLGQCDSGAYYLASQTGRINASRTTQTGSIGVRIVIRDTSKAHADAGEQVIAIDSGPHKSTGVDGLKLTDVQRARLEQMVREKADDFIAAVARGRGLEIDRVQELATGASWHAEEAVQLGLLDRVCTLAETIDELTAHVANQRNTPTTRRPPAMAHQINAAALSKQQLTDEQLEKIAEATGLSIEDLTAETPAEASSTQPKADKPAENKPEDKPGQQAEASTPAALSVDEQVQQALVAQRKVDANIRAACEAVGLGKLAETFIAQGATLPEVHAKLLERVGKDRELELADGGERAEASSSDPDAAYKAEYRKHLPVFQSRGVSEADYVSSRRIEDGLELLPTPTNQPAAK